MNLGGLLPIKTGLALVGNRLQAELNERRKKKGLQPTVVEAYDIIYNAIENAIQFRIAGTLYPYNDSTLKSLIAAAIAKEGAKGVIQYAVISWVKKGVCAAEIFVERDGKKETIKTEIK